MPKLLFAFPVAILIAFFLALYAPALLTPLQYLIVPLLAVIMFGMGMSLKLSDFKHLRYQRRELVTGLFLQYSLMPLLAYWLATLFSLPLAVTAGVVLLGACPGGTASNVMCYLAQGNLALSITMTACSTFFSLFLTPWLTWFYIGQRVDVPVASMMVNIFKIIFLPVALGMSMNVLWGRHLQRAKLWFPRISMFAIVFIIAIIIALNAEHMIDMSIAVAGVVVLHNLLGFGLAYIFSIRAGFTQANCRTIAIEVAMQNSGLAVALALKYLSPVASLPAALFSVWHNISMGILANYWRSKSTGQAA